jgi:hypothetical protein
MAHPFHRDAIYIVDKARPECYMGPVSTSTVPTNPTTMVCGLKVTMSRVIFAHLKATHPYFKLGVYDLSSWDREFPIPEPPPAAPAAPAAPVAPAAPAAPAAPMALVALAPNIAPVVSLSEGAMVGGGQDSDEVNVDVENDGADEPPICDRSTQPTNAADFDAAQELVSLSDGASPERRKPTRHACPRGRRPTGKIWNAETGEWLDNMSVWQFQDPPQTRSSIQPKPLNDAPTAVPPRNFSVDPIEEDVEIVGRRVSVYLDDCAFLGRIKKKRLIEKKKRKMNMKGVAASMEHFVKFDDYDKLWITFGLVPYKLLQVGA